MRVLFVNGIDWVGGAERCILGVARGMAARGHGTALAHAPGSPVGDEARAAGIETEVLAWDGLADRIRAGRYEVVVSSVRREHAPVARAARRAGLAGSVARIMSGWDPSRSPPGPARRLGRRLGGRRFIHLAVTNSVAGRERARADGFLKAERIAVIRNGVDLARFDPDRVTGGGFRRELGISAGSPLVVSLSRFAPRKGQAFELEAMGRLMARRPDLHAVFAGPCRESDREYRDGLRHRAMALAPAGRIRFLLARDDVPGILRDADLLLRCATEEGLPNVVLEAMAMRVPVVATRICGTPEAVADGRTGCLVPPADVSAIASAAEKILEDSATRVAKGRAGRERVARHFSMAGMLDRYERLFARAAASNRKRRVG